MREDIYDPDYVAALFDRCSARYRWWSAVSSFGFVWLWRRQCVDRIVAQRQIARIEGGRIGAPPNQMAEVVDLMAGTGEVWPHLLRVLPHAQITAIDISERMHREAVERLHAERATRITHLAANALETDLPDGVADVVVSTFGLKTFNRAQHAVLARQVARLLRPGGSFCLIEASDPRGWTLRPFYRAYMDGILPLIERFFLKGAQDFSMIGTYTKNFGDCSGFADDLSEAGLVVTQRRHFFGCATSVAGTKPVAPDAPSD